MIELNSYYYQKDFLNQEYRDGYRISSATKELWAVELDLLVKLQTVCEKYKLQYFADFGTLLGAIRHKGYIPWDDDIDLTMLREDYEKLRSVAHKEFTAPYFWQDEYSDPGVMCRNMAKLRNSDTTGILRKQFGKGYRFNQGIFIDIFPLDNLPPVSERERFWNNLKELRSKSLLSDRNYEAPNEYCVQIEKIARTYDDKPSKLIGSIAYSLDRRDGIRRSIDYASAVEVPFENISISVPVGYKEVLRREYGTWNVPAYEDSAHGEIFVDVNKSYKTYIKNLNKYKEKGYLV